LNKNEPLQPAQTEHLSTFTPRFGVTTRNTFNPCLLLTLSIASKDSRKAWMESTRLFGLLKNFPNQGRSEKFLLTRNQRCGIFNRFGTSRPTNYLPFAMERATMQNLEQSQLIERVVQRLAQSSVSELRQIRVDSRPDGLHLSGRVGSYYHKQLAQETIRDVTAGQQVFNQLAVCN
jgi:BON domain